MASGRGGQAFKVDRLMQLASAKLAKLDCDAFQTGHVKADQDFTSDGFITRGLCFDVRRFSGVEALEALKVNRDPFRYPLERALA